MTLSRVAEIVRRHDRNRFLTALFAPPDRREALFTLYAFNYEIAKTREVVTEPMLGQIRLQWWREAIEGIYGGRARRHEIVEPLTRVVADHGLSRAHFDALIDAREEDLEPDPPPSLAALVDYAEASSGRLVLLALEILGAREAAEPGRHVGIAYGLAGLLRAAPFHARAQRTYFPRDFADPNGAARAIAAAARRHLALARELRASRAALPALLPAVVADRWLDRLAAAGDDPFAAPPERGDPLLPARLALAAWRRRW